MLPFRRHHYVLMDATLPQTKSLAPLGRDNSEMGCLLFSAANIR